MYRVVRYYLICGLLLGLGLLSGCSVYDSIFHPHRLGTPTMSPEAKAKLKAAEKARHKGLTLQTATDAPADDAAGAPANAAGDAATPAAADKTKTYNELPAGTRATYDKQGLLKKSMLTRFQQSKRQLHHYDTHPLKPNKATKAERRLRKHSKNKGNAAPEPKEYKEPARPAPAPTPPAPKPEKAEKVKAAKPKKDKNAPEPDPTQPLPGDN